MKPRLMNTLWTGCAAAAAAGLVWLAGCGGGDEPAPDRGPESLNVLILNLGDGFTPPAAAAVNRIDRADGELVVNATPETVAADASFASLSALWEGYDMVVFPSLLNRTLREHRTAFYPMPATAAQGMELLDRAYAIPESDEKWAAPLGIDPVMLLVKHSAPQAIGDTLPPRDWPRLAMISGVLRGDGLPLPHLVFPQRPPHAFADALTAYFLNLGLEDRTLGMAAVGETGESPPELIELQSRSLLPGLIRLFAGENADGEEIEIPFVDELESFYHSDAVMTFAALSRYRAMKNEQRREIFAIPVPRSTPKPVLVGAVSAAAVPLAAPYPDIALRLAAIWSKGADGGGESGWVSLSGANDSLELNEKPIVVPRETAASLTGEVLEDFIAGSLTTPEFAALWRRGYFWPAD